MLSRELKEGIHISNHAELRTAQCDPASKAS
jgi:hypothetical protein